jgi:hypothetical protein
MMNIVNDVLSLLFVLLQLSAGLVLFRFAGQLCLVYAFGFEARPLSEKSKQRLDGVKNRAMWFFGVKKPQPTVTIDRN